VVVDNGLFSDMPVNEDQLLGNKSSKNRGCEESQTSGINALATVLNIMTGFESVNQITNRSFKSLY
jgi:hypothetical protein